MNHVNIVVWDNIGNTVLGMRPWEAWSEQIRERLLTEDPDARSRVIGWRELLANHDVNLVWLYDPEKAKRGFGTLFEEYRDYLRPVISPVDITEALKDADFFILHKEQFGAAALESASKLRLIQHLGLDYRGVPMEAARERRIPVAATPLLNYSAVAEHVWAMMLAYYKRLPDQREYMQSRAYLQEWGAYHPGVKIMSDLTLGLLGMGEIARPIARVAQAFGMRIIYWDIVRFPELEDRYGMEFVEWDDLFASADTLSVQLALNERTEGSIGSREFDLMKQDALFVNTARGKLVDEPALIEALESGSIGGAALDVYANEPLAADSPLHDLHESVDHNVILTPHSAAQGPWTWIRDSQELWFNIDRTLRGERAHHLVNWS